jgi:hypothetical protein
MAPFDQILHIAEESSIASFRWKDRGVAPRGYVKGMSVVYARLYCKLKAGDPGALEMAKPDTSNPDRDALTWYAALFNDVGMDNHTAGVSTLRHLFVLLIGLGMRESSGRHCEGRDRSASNVTADTAEAGLFQSSFNASHANELLPQLFQHYLRHPSGFGEIFKEGVACRPSDLENFGTGGGKEFQPLSKECPAFAAEFAAIGLRHLRKHWGPINRKEAQLVPECDAMLRSVQEIVDATDLCPMLL